MLNFLDLELQTFGLDISNRSLKAVKLTKRGKFFKLVSWGETEINKGIIENGEIKKEAELADAVKKFISGLKGKSLDTKNVIACLPEEKAFLEVIEMPKIEEEEGLRTAVMFEAENHIPLPLEKSYLDFQVLTSENKRQSCDILVAAIPQEISNSYFLCLRKAGLNPVVLEVESQSIARAVIKNENSSEPVLIIDFGANTASFIIYAGQSLRFTSTIPVSSGILDDSLAESLKIDLKKAEGLKIKYGLKGKTKEGERVSKILQPVADSLVSNIVKYLNYYQTHKDNSEKKISKIILAGRGSNLKGLSETIFSKTRISTDLCNPWVNIMPEPFNEVPGISREQSLGYATALGLALRGVKKYD